MTAVQSLKFFALSLMFAVPLAHADNFVLPPLPDEVAGEDDAPAIKIEIPDGGTSVNLASLAAHLYREDAKAVPYFKTVVLPLDGFMVQGIPSRNVNYFHAAEIIKVANSRGRPYYFHISPGAQELMDYFQRQKIEVRFFSLLSTDVAVALMDAFFIPSLGQPLSKVSSLKVANGTLRLGYFGDEDKTLMVINEGVRAENSDQVLDAGPVYYAFPDYKEAKRSFDPNEQNHFARSEEEFLAEQNKASRMLFVLAYTNKTDKNTFLKRLQELNNVSALEMAQFGKDFSATGTFERLHFVPVVDEYTRTLIACQVQDKITGAVIQNTVPADCDGQ